MTSTTIPLKSNNNFHKLPILVTGGAGYIGSHTCIELYEAGFTNIVIIDNFSNSSPESIKRIERICNENKTITVSNNTSNHKPLKIIHYNLDLSANESIPQLDKICIKHQFFTCIHFAGLKSVGESVKKSLLYYQNNIMSTINLLQALHKSNCRNIIFSSSATVYGIQAVSPINESFPVGLGITNPYGKTKYFIEEILSDFAVSNKDWNVIILRYFNPIGAHKSGLIGEDPLGIPNNLMPFLTRVAIAQMKKNTDIEYYNKYSKLYVFGDDYETEDGTGVRDYIHVVDLAQGHVCSLIEDILAKNNRSCLSKNSINCSLRENVSIYNLGTGCGTSVLQLRQALSNACGFEIPYEVVDRRAGDIGSVYADCSYAARKLKWKAKLGIVEACEDSWRWQMKNPYGFRKKSSGKQYDLS